MRETPTNVKSYGQLLASAQSFNSKIKAPSTASAKTFKSKRTSVKSSHNSSTGAEQKPAFTTGKYLTKGTHSPKMMPISSLQHFRSTNSFNDDRKSVQSASGSVKKSQPKTHTKIAPKTLIPPSMRNNKNFLVNKSSPAVPKNMSSKGVIKSKRNESPVLTFAQNIQKIT